MLVPSIISGSPQIPRLRTRHFLTHTKTPSSFSLFIGSPKILSLSQNPSCFKKLRISSSSNNQSFQESTATHFPNQHEDYGIEELGLLDAPLFGQSSCSRKSIKRWHRSGNTSVVIGYGGAKVRRLGRRFKVSATTTSSSFGDQFADDYYAVFGLVPDATPEQIKKAYYSCMKSCHPDLSGNDPDTTNFCMFINDVYEVLSDPVQRRVYDEIHGYALTAINPFLDDSCPKDHVFVDEFSCIGCKNCANVAPSVFDIEEDFGRARAYSQCGNPEAVQQAIDSCPVDCIYWTSAPQLSLLEDEMRRVERVNVALMLSGMGSMGVDVFRTANSRWEKRQSKILAQARMRMMKQHNSKESDSYWSNVWGNPKDGQDSEEEAKERGQRAAAAARKWREYSRKGADKPPKYKLPEALSNKDK